MVDRVIEEKKRLEESNSKDKLLLSKQLFELKERSEGEIREKNENIIRLNNLLNEKLEHDDDPLFPDS